MKNLPAQPVQGLMDGITVLKFLAQCEEPISTLELSEELSMEKTRVNRLLKTLDFLDIAYRTGDRRYVIGPGIHALAAQSMYASGLIQTAVKYLEPLQKYGLVIALGFLAGDKVSYFYHWEPGISSIEALGRISMYPVEQSSIGVVLMGHKSKEELSDIKKKIKTRKGDASQLDDLIDFVRDNNYSLVSKGKNVSISVSLGQPVFGAIALSGAIKKNEVEKFVNMLQECASSIDQEIKNRKK